jgi:hypothetical protein
VRLGSGECRTARSSGALIKADRCFIDTPSSQENRRTGAQEYFLFFITGAHEITLAMISFEQCADQSGSVLHRYAFITGGQENRSPGVFSLLITGAHEITLAMIWFEQCADQSGSVLHRYAFITGVQV